MSKTLQHILCIDDEADILEVAKMSLETVGEFTVTTLSSGAEAVAKAVGINPDFILVDMMMPGMDGRSTLAALRKLPELNRVPIAFMTARVQANEQKEYLELGAAGVVPKPFDPMTLADEVRAIWEAYRAG